MRLKYEWSDDMKREKEHRRKRKWNQGYFLQVVCLLVVVAILSLNQEAIREYRTMRQGTLIEEDFVEEINQGLQVTSGLQQEKCAVVPSNSSNLEEEFIKSVKEEKSRSQIDKLDSNIRGAYFSASRVSNSQKVEEIIQSLQGSGINAVVIDVKDDRGNITFATQHALAIEIDAVNPCIWNVQAMTEQFHAAGFYVIGRVVAFRDPILAVSHPSYAVRNLDGSVFYDRAKDTWLNPYYEPCWEYIVDIAMEAVEYGFDEIQFDYMRFSTEAKEEKVSFGKKQEGYSKTEVITDFVQYAVKRLHQKDAKVSADVFGAIIHSEIDAKTVGQDYVELSRYLDYICPMIYPSHYADGCYGLEVPDLQPYELILAVLKESSFELMAIDEEYHCAVVRPWLQDFTASWKSVYQQYGLLEVKAQIQGVYDSGYQEWLLWNSSGRYSTADVK